VLRRHRPGVGEEVDRSIADTACSTAQVSNNALHRSLRVDHPRTRCDAVSIVRWLIAGNRPVACFLRCDLVWVLELLQVDRLSP
jgi:hypothetical protein